METHERQITMSTKSRYRGLRPNPENLGVKPLAEGVSYTKPIRFTLPEALAKELEGMRKADRDEIVRAALADNPFPAPTTFIYGLVNPETKVVVYVGKSNRPAQRMTAYRSDLRTGRGNQEINALMRELADKGLELELEILEEVPYDEWQEAERKWIKELQGQQLLNDNAGGGGGQGAVPSHKRLAIWATSEALQQFAALSPRKRGRLVEQALAEVDLVGLRLPIDLVAALDKLGGRRTSHIEQALRAYLNEQE